MSAWGPWWGRAGSEEMRWALFKQRLCPMSWMEGPDDRLHCPHHCLQTVRGLIGPKSDGDADGQQTLIGASVEGNQDGRGEGDSSYLAQEVQPLLCHLRHGGGVEGPGTLSY